MYICMYVSAGLCRGESRISGRGFVRGEGGGGGGIHKQVPCKNST